MAFIVGKKQDGKTYYYLAESARVGGRPRIVSQRYLVSAVWQMLGRLRVAEIVDGVVGARRSDAGASVGTYIALATLNRVVDPCSKLAFSDWWDKTACDRWLRLSPGALDHRRFWEAMDAIDEARLQEIERRIVSAMVETFSIDLSGLVLDMTNFATWIDSANGRARSRSADTPSRREATCASSGWALWCPPTAGSLWSPTPIRGTSPTSPSSGR